MAGSAACRVRVVTRRYELGRPIVVTANKPYGAWNQMFPRAACVVPLVDRMVLRSEFVKIHGDSYRLKQAKERAATEAASPRSSKPPD